MTTAQNQCSRNVRVVDSGCAARLPLFCLPPRLAVCVTIPQTMRPTNLFISFEGVGFGLLPVPGAFVWNFEINGVDLLAKNEVSSGGHVTNER